MNDFFNFHEMQSLDNFLIEHKVDLFKDVTILEDKFIFIFFSTKRAQCFKCSIAIFNNDCVMLIKSKWHNAHYLINSALKRANDSHRGDFSPQESIDHYRYKTVVDTDMIEQEWFDHPPFHNSIDSHTRFILMFNQDKIQRLVTETGYSSRYLEHHWKMNSFYKLQHRLHLISPRIGFEFSELLTHGFENMLNVELGDHSKAIRMVFLELTRIENHLKYLHTMMLEISDPHHKPINQLIASMQRLLVKINAQHGLNYSLVFGGVSHIVPVGWFNQCFELVRQIEHFFFGMKELISIHEQNFIKLNSGHTCYEQVIHGGLSGPNLRACGINWDLRTKEKKYFYDQLDFNTAVGVQGSTFDRIMVRIQEIIYSSQLVEQLTDNMPELSSRDKSYEYSKEEYLWSGIKEKNIDSHQLFHLHGEASQGEMHMLFKIHSQEQKIEIVRLTTPSFMSFSYVNELAVGKTAEEFRLLYKSLAICSWERDL